MQEALKTERSHHTLLLDGRSPPRTIICVTHVGSNVAKLEILKDSQPVTRKMFEEVPMGHLTTLQHWDTTEVDLEDWQVNLANECLKTI